jgi:uncharacterized membrane protein YcaP (DUF421 family)
MDATSSIFFVGWWPIVRVIVIGVVGYFTLLLALRASGPRSMARTNLFDIVIVASIGSVYGRILTAKDVTLVESLVAYLLVVSMPYAVSWLRARSQRVAAVIDTEPVLLYLGGRYMRRAMLKARVIERDLEAAARMRGMCTMADVEAVILEADGELSVLSRRAGATEQDLAGSYGRLAGG